MTEPPAIMRACACNP